MSLNKKSVRSINNFDDIEPLMNANPRRLSDKDRRLTYIDGWQPSQGNEFVSENEDDELIQSQRKRAGEFVSKCSRRPQLKLPEERQEQRWVKDRLDRSCNIYQRIITTLKEKGIHGYKNMTVMSNRIKIVRNNIPQNINSKKISMMLLQCRIRTFFGHTVFLKLRIG